MTHSAAALPIPASLSALDPFSASAATELWLQGAVGFLHAFEMGAQALISAADAYRSAVAAVAGGAMSTYPAALAEFVGLGPEICMEAAASRLRTAGLDAPLLNDA